ncbi:MAG: hypothetical protein INR70_02145 [Parafilimonas terrae]|nr:hypothetical protein [Parafilimonas terrae]
MRRWPTILLCLVLFAAAMLVVRAVLVAVLPSFNRWMDQALGASTWTAIVILAAIAGGIFGFWPRDAQGRMKPLSRR